MVRRLPVFLVLDCSESMAGVARQRMQDGLQAIVASLRQDPQALETVHFGVIAFAGVARAITPLIELSSFYPPRLPLGGGTAIGAALDALMIEMDRQIVRSTPQIKGDWRPLVYLFTDGRTTDDPEAALGRWNRHHAKRCTLIAVGLGRDADLMLLWRITDHVVLFDGQGEVDFAHFVRWVSASVALQSRSQQDRLDARALPPIGDAVLKITPSSLPATPVAGHDEHCATFVGRCAVTHRPYLIRYEREEHKVASRDFVWDASRYRLAGCYPLDEDYFSWTQPGADATSRLMSTAALIGAPGCPHCSHPIAFAVCACGRLMCTTATAEKQQQECPWCSRKITFSTPASNNAADFEVGRGRG